jgi:hypothetical protein
MSIEKSTVFWALVNNLTKRPRHMEMPGKIHFTTKNTKFTKSRKKVFSLVVFVLFVVDLPVRLEPPGQSEASRVVLHRFSGNL